MRNRLGETHSTIGKRGSNLVARGAGHCIVYPPLFATSATGQGPHIPKTAQHQQNRRSDRGTDLQPAGESSDGHGHSCAEAHPQSSQCGGDENRSHRMDRQRILAFECEPMESGWRQQKHNRQCQHPQAGRFTYACLSRAPALFAGPRWNLSDEMRLSRL
jgi:hypothetical protein